MARVSKYAKWSDRVDRVAQMAAKGYTDAEIGKEFDATGQMIYAVQFHLEKSFEDWSKNPTRWQHPNESRDGRILFENFLKLAVKHKR